MEEEKQKTETEIRKLERKAERRLTKQENEHQKALSTERRVTQDLSSALERERDRYVQFNINKTPIHPFNVSSNVCINVSMQP